MDAREMRELIAAKQAYGVKTTRLENELWRLERAALPAWRRWLGDAAFGLLVWGFSALFWAAHLYMAWRLIASLFS